MSAEKKIDEQQVLGPGPIILAGCMGFMMICAWAFAGPKAFQRPTIDVELTENVDSQTEEIKVTETQATETNTTTTIETENAEKTTTATTIDQQSEVNTQTTTSAEQPTTDNTQTTTSAEQPTTDSTQTTTSAEQPTTDNTQTTTSTEQPNIDNTQTTTSDNTQTTTTSTEQPTTDTTQTTTNTSEGNATSKPEQKTTNTTKDLGTISESQGKYLTEAKTLGQIKFDINEIKLSSPAKETINSLISEIKEYDPNRVTIKVEGHTSKVGDARLNQEISQDRANIVVKYLKGQNLPYQVIGEGVGYSQPLPNIDPASNVNQRTVIILTPIN